MKNENLVKTGKYSTMEAARLLGVHRNTLGLWVSKGYLKCYLCHRTGRRYYMGKDLMRFARIRI